MTDFRPANVQWLMPYLMVQDARRSLDFYTTAFEFKSRRVIEEQGQLMHVEFEHHGEMVLMLSPEGVFGSEEKAPATLDLAASQVFYLYVDDVDRIYRQALDAGAKSLVEPTFMFWGDRFAVIEDLDGYRWALARHLSHQS